MIDKLIHEDEDKESFFAKTFKVEKPQEIKVNYKDGTSEFFNLWGEILADKTAIKHLKRDEVETVEVNFNITERSKPVIYRKVNSI